MILELNNRLERLGLSVGLQSPDCVACMSDYRTVSSVALLCLFLTATPPNYRVTQIQTRSISTTTPMSLMTLHIPSLPLQVYLACPPALDVNPTTIDMDTEL